MNSGLFFYIATNLDVMMNKPKFKLFPCVFCTIGFNAYVVGHKMMSATNKVLFKQETSSVEVKMSPEHSGLPNNTSER